MARTKHGRPISQSPTARKLRKTLLDRRAAADEVWRREVAEAAFKMQLGLLGMDLLDTPPTPPRQPAFTPNFDHLAGSEQGWRDIYDIMHQPSLDMAEPRLELELCVADNVMAVDTVVNGCNECLSTPGRSNCICAPIEQASDDEDGGYSLCTGSCGRQQHHEDTDEFGMCGRCQYEAGKFAGPRPALRQRFKQTPVIDLTESSDEEDQSGFQSPAPLRCPDCHKLYCRMRGQHYVAVIDLTV
jgi:hypothetical protein